MDDEQLNQEEEQNSSEEKATSGAQQVGRQVADKAADMAKETVKKGAKQAAKAVGQAIAHAVTSVVAALGPWLIPIILVVVILFFAIAYWGVIAEIPGKIKDAFTGFIDNIVGIFTFDDSTSAYNISNDQLDKIIQDLEDSGVNIEEYDLTKKDLQTFLEAELITQTVDGISVGDKKGAIQIYMTDPTNETETLGSRKLNYMPYSQFNEAVSSANSSGNASSSLLNSYTVDTANNILVVARNENWTKVDGSETNHDILYITKSFGYKTVTAQYQMPFMFFIDLCMISNNKEYVLAVADQVKNTQIIITVQNTRTETYEKTTETTTETVESTETNTVTTTEKTITIENMSISDSLTPVVTKADTLLFTKEMVYTNKTERTGTDSSWTLTNKYSPGIDKETNIKVEEFGNTAKSTSYSNGEAYNSLITGGDMLFEILSQDVNNETIEQTLKYILYKLSGVNYGVTGIDESWYKLGTLNSASIGGTGIVGGTTQDKVWYSLINLGFTEYQVAGVMGNITRECDWEVDQIEHGTGEGIGLCQWSFDRKKNLKAYAESKGSTWQNEDIQIEFLIGELTRGGGADGYAYYNFMDRAKPQNGRIWKVKDFETAQDIETAVEAFMWTFERPNEADGIASLQKGINAAKQFYEYYHGREMISPSVSADVSQILNYSATEGWLLVTGNRFSSKPSLSQYTESMANSLMTTIEVKVRVWKNAGSKDSTDLEKVDSTKKLTVNKYLAEFWTSFFNDIYNQCPDFVVDKSNTCVYVYKYSGSRLSAHAFGTALDLNWDTTGNGYKPWGVRGPYTEDEWRALPETRTKYETIYINGPIHKLAQQYTLEWGGSWNTYDGMHLSYVGDMSDRCRK